MVNTMFDRSRRCALGAVSLALAVAMGGCSDSGEDVRVVLCKDVALALLPSGSSVTDWTSLETRMDRSEDLAVDVGFSVRDGDGAVRGMRASCLYPYDAVEDTALTLADPMSAYSTSPRRVVLNGRAISNPQLAEAVRRAMLSQGRDLLERTRSGVEDAARHVGLDPSGAQAR